MDATLLENGQISTPACHHEVPSSRNKEASMATKDSFIETGMGHEAEHPDSMMMMMMLICYSCTIILHS
jgi:hypothetical protein